MQDRDTATVLISACLLGFKVRYDGGSKTNEFVVSLSKKINYEPICPEMAGGLPCPRPASEIKGSRVVTETGQDVSEQFVAGAKDACQKAQAHGSRLAILKTKSPSCSSGKVYDGSFSGTLIDGLGISAKALQDMSLLLLDENQLHELKVSKEHPIAVFVSYDNQKSIVCDQKFYPLVQSFVYSDNQSFKQDLNAASVQGSKIALVVDGADSFITPILGELLNAYKGLPQDIREVLHQSNSNPVSGHAKLLAQNKMQVFEVSKMADPKPTINVILSVLINLLK